MQLNLHHSSSGPYSFSLMISPPAISGVERITFHSPVTYFVGENGSGKSTLLEAMAISDGFNPEGGTRNYSFSTYDSHSELWDAIRLSRQERAKWGYFLDEPEAALSPQRQLALLLEIDRCRKQGAQFFIVTHSPILLGLPDAAILSFDGGKIHPCTYEETDSYQIMSMFLNDRERILSKLLG